VALESGSWNWLEVAKLAIAVMTPLSVVAFGWFISRRLKRFELLQWSNQKLIEKRIAIYDQVGPPLNQLYCFYSWVGSWKETSPADVLRLKRELDQKMYVYGHLFEGELLRAYQNFMHTLFETYQGVGVDAKIRSVVRGPEGDRSTHLSEAWKPEWDTRFADPSREASLAEVRSKYNTLIREFSQSWGVRE